MAGSDSSKPQTTYSPIFGFVYIFNLIIGVGALTLPRAFTETGLVLASILLVLLCGLSFLTSTYVIEAMAAANAYSRLEERQQYPAVQASFYGDKKREGKSVRVNGPSHPSRSYSINGSGSTSMEAPVSVPQALASDHGNASIDSDNETAPLISSAVDDYEISKKFEMGTMVNMFYHPVGIVLYYICICLYLYGDLAIYVVAIPKSITTTVCPKFKTSAPNTSNGTVNSSSHHDDDICFNGTSVTRDDAYYLFLVVAIAILCPWAFFNLTKSKYLQLATTIMRNTAFSFMIIYAIVELCMGKHAHPPPSAADFKNFPIFFGVSVYAFMVHHSLPGMITPMRTKKHLTALLASDYLLILFFYLVMAYTGAFRFPLDESLKDGLQDLYTLTFFRVFRHAEIVLRIVGYYLALFPVFILATNFPIISITLRENLKALTRICLRRWMGDRPFPFLVDRIVFPLVAVIPPVLIALGTQNEEILVSITGSFPGIGVQYIIPATLAFAGRRIIMKKYGQYDNKHRSPFSHVIFIVAILVWALISVLLTVASDILKIVEGKFTNA